MRLYIAGPMSGKPNNNAAAFAAAAGRLRSEGHEVHSPVEFDWNSGVDHTRQATDTEYEDYLGRDFEVIHECDAVVFLPGFEWSGGAGREGRLAIELGKPLFLYIPELPGALMTIGANTFLAQTTTERARAE
jgi:hypothetical protein